MNRGLRGVFERSAKNADRSVDNPVEDLANERAGLPVHQRARSGVLRDQAHRYVSEQVGDPHTAVGITPRQAATGRRVGLIEFRDCPLPSGYATSAR